MFSYLVCVVSSSLFLYPLLIFENSFGMLGERDVYLLIRYSMVNVVLTVDIDIMFLV